MLKQLFIILLVLGGIWFLMFGLSDQAIDTFQKQRRIFVGHLQTAKKGLGVLSPHHS